MNLLLFSAVVLAISCDPFVFPPVPAEFITETDAQVVCVSTRLSHCQNKFADALNMPEGSSWSDPNQMGQTLAILYTSGVSGLIKTCNARQQFQECLGDTYTACMSVPRFVAAGESPLNAVQYTQIFNALEFDCNGGFVQASSNWPCILGVWTTSANDLENCFNTFNATVAANPTQVCAATYKYETCTRQLFGYGCNAEVMRTVFFLLAVLTASAVGQLILPLKLSDETIQVMAQSSKRQVLAFGGCVGPQFNDCQKKLTTALGLNNTLTYQTGTQFLTAVNNLLQVDIPGILNVCKARTKFYQCLGDTYYSCLNMFTILQMPGATYQNTLDYTRTYSGLEFSCNAGFEEVVTQWDCMRGAPQTKPVLACMSQFNETVNPAALCPTVDSTSQCIYQAYGRNCVDKGAAFFGCENFRFTFDQICYGLRCNVVDIQH